MTSCEYAKSVQLKLTVFFSIRKFKLKFWGNEKNHETGYNLYILFCFAYTPSLFAHGLRTAHLLIFKCSVVPPYDYNECVECPLGARCKNGTLEGLVKVNVEALLVTFASDNP